MLANRTLPTKTLAPTIILTGGGSGGHITPLLSLARELKSQKPQCRTIYIGWKGEKIEAGFDVFDETYFVPAGKYRRYSGQSLLANLADLKTIILNLRDLF